MKKFKVCVESYLFNNSDLKEYDIYYLNGKSLETATSYAKKVLKHWRNVNGIIYNLFTIEEVK
jgi:hypothetical protein